MTEATYRTIHVIQGEHHVSDRPEDMLTTVLGSCVAACIYDPRRRVGGMNHFLLPDTPGARDIRYASAAMEQLVNSMLKRGAVRERLEAKIFGGGRMLKGLPDIGQRNGEAALAFLRGEGIVVRAQSLGGTQARRIRFWPATGQAKQMLLHNAGNVDVRTPPPAPVGNTIELF